VISTIWRRLRRAYSRTVCIHSSSAVVMEEA
jgi:hypothetical protein